KTEEEYRSFLKEAIYPELQALKLRIKSEKLLTPKVIYGYFPCQSDGNDLIIYKPKIISNIESAYGGRISNPPKADEFRNFQEWMRFTFPRQKSDRFLCLSDYFASKTSSLIDVVAFQIVTVGSIAVEYSKKLYSQNSYKDYLYFHGISVKAAEALAELWHKKIRQELNIHQKDATEKKKIFSQGYQGSRYSFGYPACPNLEDQVKLFELLKPERIGIELTEEFHLVPEQSTSAIIVHHPEAKYFNI
ncbi:MAG: vitamin B12 dependent-methionine synthase activation domain-containing protein, partial [Bacteroidota bacterium]